MAEVSWKFLAPVGKPLSFALGLLNAMALATAHAQIDYSDAPPSFGSPSHTMSSNLYMGECVDDEPAAQPDANAGGDDTGIDSGTVFGLCSDFDPSPPNPFRDDEDILEIFTVTDGQSSPQFDVNIINTSGGPATVKCWIDYNGNGIFENSVLESPPSATVTTSGSTATILFSDTPAAANAATGGVTYLRCRLGSNPAEVVDPVGAASDGEVEDHRVIVYEQISVCPAGTVQVPFSWNSFAWSGPGNGITGVTGVEVGSTNETALLFYNDSLGFPRILTVNAQIIDPNERNCDGDPYAQGFGLPYGPYNPVTAADGTQRTPWVSDHTGSLTNPNTSSCSRKGTRVNGGNF